MKNFFKQPLFLFFIALYPGLSLLAYNIREVEWPVVLRPLLATFALALVIFGGLYLFLRDRNKAALLAFAAFLMLFSYGHILDYLLNSALVGKPNRFLTLTFALIFIGLAFWLFRTKKDLHDAVSAVNFLSIVLVGFSLWNITAYELTPEPAPVYADTVNLTLPENPPDIYYIILDGYSRADVLAEMGYDNTDFIQFLQTNGFYVAECSRSNYRKTVLSIPSALNMDYLYDFIPNEGFADKNLTPIINSLKDNRVRLALKKLGYTDISFDMGFKWATWWDADLYLPKFNRYMTYFESSTLTPFEMMYLQTSFFGTLMNRNLVNVDPESNFFASDKGHYDRVNYILDELPALAPYPSPKLVYAHIIVPHSPYIFLPDGAYDPSNGQTFLPGDETITEDFRGYIHNVQFINTRIKIVIQNILQNSSTPPIIIVQADHSLVLDFDDRRFNILNAYYLPDGKADALYPTITPVNSFRLIFNQYFNANLPLLDDKSITSDVGHPYSTLEASVTACP